MKVLVTGGTGYIGSHTVVELQQNGYEVVIADNFSNSSPSVADSIEKITGKKPALVKTELCNPDDCNKLFDTHPDIKAVVHFAAFKAVGESVTKPLKYYKNNIFSLANVLDAMNEKDIKFFIFSSSCTVYGIPDELPVSEKSPVKPANSPYGNTKQIAEEILRDEVARGKGLKVISLRYFNPIGAHPSVLIGENCKDEPNNLVPYITETAIGKRPFLRVFGNDYDTHDGTPIRDYIHVTDLAEAHVKAVKRLTENRNDGPFEVFNLGTGNGFSVKEVIDAFEKVSGIKLSYKIVDRRPGDIPAIWADTKYANKVLNWTAKKTLEEMVSTAWEWEKKKN